MTFSHLADVAAKCLVSVARIILAGDWNPSAIAQRLRAGIPHFTRSRFPAAFPSQLLQEFPEAPGILDLVERLNEEETVLQWAKRRRFRELDITQRNLSHMLPARGAFRKWELPPLVTVGSLADWLELSVNELEWYADARSWERRRMRETSRHYHYHWIAKTERRARLLETPKPILKGLQRKILHEMLNHVPIHAAAHGFCRGRSPRSFVIPHSREFVVWKLDLRNFFSSIRRPRISAIFKTLGYPDSVAQLLAGLCCNAVPTGMLESGRPLMSAQEFASLKLLLTTPHLPQGAPTSPALSNFVAWKLDCRLSGLSASVDAHYTRYADDLIFSGDRDFARELVRFRPLVLAIILQEGFRLRERKSRTMFSNQRQQAVGMVINSRPTISRKEYDQLRAILHNCEIYGPNAQNRNQHPDFRQHLLGRIQYLASIDPQRGDKLKQMFARTIWPPK